MPRRVDWWSSLLCQMGFPAFMALMLSFLDKMPPEDYAPATDGMYFRTKIDKNSAICHLLGLDFYYETYWHFQFIDKILILPDCSFETYLRIISEKLVLFVLILKFYLIDPK
jgi:hypothetical protein